MSQKFNDWWVFHGSDVAEKEAPHSYSDIRNIAYEAWCLGRAALRDELQETENE